MVLWLRFLTEINSNTKEESGDVDYELSPYNQGSIRHLFIVAYRPFVRYGKRHCIIDL